MTLLPLKRVPMNRSDITVGFFLTVRYIRGASIWTTGLIVFVMVLTFLNLTVISGILEGIVVGSFDGLRERAIGDVYISPKDGELFVDRTQYLLPLLDADERVTSISPRLGVSVEIITEDQLFNVINAEEKRKSINTTALGVDPEAEAATTNLPEHLLEGSYLSESSGRREILIGSALLERLSPFGASVLSGVHPGDFVYMRIGESRGLSNGFEQEDAQNDARSPGSVPVQLSEPSGVLQKYLVRGVYRTKAGQLDLNIITHIDNVRGHVFNPGNNVSSIAVRLDDPQNAVAVKEKILTAGFGSHAVVETVYEAIGSFLGDIRTVFQILGTVVGSIGLAVSSVTIFIIIFVTAVARQKFIGILKAIGITPAAIQISYVLYALFFAGIGVLIGLAVLYFVLVPFFDRNPIPFPFSDGVLFVTPFRTTVYVLLLLLATTIAGIIPAHRVVRRPAIDSVRGR